MQLAPPAQSSRPNVSFFICLSLVFGLLAAFFSLLATCPTCGPGPGLLALGVRILGGGNPLTRYSPKAGREPGSLSVLALGDSITFGYYTGGLYNAYRLRLLNLLTGTEPIWSVNQTINEGAPFSQVKYLGGERSGNFTNNRHEGHGGANIDEIKDFFEDAVQNYREAPDAVLLMAGTNDMIQFRNLPNAPGRLGDLIDKVLLRFPQTVMVVAGLTPIKNNQSLEAVKNQYNRALPAIVDARLQNKWKILYTDLSAVLEYTDLADEVHPKDSGHLKMAHAFYKSLIDAKDRGWFNRTEPA